MNFYWYIQLVQHGKEVVITYKKYRKTCGELSRFYPGVTVLDIVRMGSYSGKATMAIVLKELPPVKIVVILRFISRINAPFEYVKQAKKIIIFRYLNYCFF